MLGFFIFINYEKTEQGWGWFEDSAGHEVMFDEGVGLAPHGVPSAPITRNYSKNNLIQQGDGGNDVNPNSQGQQQSQQEDNYLDPNRQWGGQPYGQNLQVATTELSLKCKLRLAIFNPFSNFFLVKTSVETGSDHEKAIIMKGFRDMIEATRPRDDIELDKEGSATKSN